MLSSNVKYVGLDVHKEAIAIAVLNGAGKLVMESIVEAKASTVLDFLHGLRGELHVTLEEGTWAAWLASRTEGVQPPSHRKPSRETVDWLRSVWSTGRTTSPNGDRAGCKPPSLSSRRGRTRFFP
jgi:hypothetical protein